MNEHVRPTTKRAVNEAVGRRTIGASDNPAVIGGMRAKNNGRYNGNGREWRTPPDLYAKLDAEFHFTLDPCTTQDNPLGAPFFLTEAENALIQNWHDHRVFMNPPYGAEIAAWTRKARESAKKGALVVGLLPASTDLAWWHYDVMGHAEVRYIRGRVRFLTDGRYRASGFFASVIVIWRPPVDSPCNAVTTIGSYPGEQSFGCVGSLGHRGDHEATVEWTEDSSPLTDGQNASE